MRSNLDFLFMANPNRIDMDKSSGDRRNAQTQVAIVNCKALAADYVTYEHHFVSQ